MSTPLFILLGVAFFVAAAASDYLETRYVQAVHERAAGGDRRSVETAARCSVAMWLIGVVGLVACVEISWWLMIFEGAGLYVGTRMAMRAAK